MEILIVLLVLFVFTVIPVKVGASFLNIDGATIGVCFFAVILSIIANVLAIGFIGKGFFPSIIALIITGIFFSWLFKTNTVTGFVLATISIVVQFSIVFIAAKFWVLHYPN
ncbi:hypothetical protein B0W48_01495 [Pseudoalteromonas aliena]|uniref:Phage holin family protein n=1 Tax=Pseudoalteromonas aliena TaxID=247523 RepID=A0A1Q2GTZ8_9GAMM|nr:hypothetical protein [Pseudoalteromonas aliena]AQP98585.1 hypothetical protein B0W48_01495 [Pseudoalteromonas aliena]